MTWRRKMTTASGSSHSPLLRTAALSAVADDDLTEVGAALKMPIRVRRRFEREYPINYRPQAMQRDRPVHRLEIGPTADADRSQRHAAPAQQQRVEHYPGSGQARPDQADLAANGEAPDRIGVRARPPTLAD